MPIQTEPSVVLVAVAAGAPEHVTGPDVGSVGGLKSAVGPSQYQSLPEALSPLVEM